MTGFRRATNWSKASLFARKSVGGNPARSLHFAAAQSLVGRMKRGETHLFFNRNYYMTSFVIFQSEKQPVSPFAMGFEHVITVDATFPARP